jgi:hypothetical protein
VREDIVSRSRGRSQVIGGSTATAAAQAVHRVARDSLFDDLTPIAGSIGPAPVSAGISPSAHDGDGSTGSCPTRTTQRLGRVLEA